MKLEYKTDRLPLNFIILGYLLLAIAIWRIIVIDWRGIIFLLISVFLIFFKSGIIIDTDKKLLKKYNGIFSVKKGVWENINQLINLQVIKSNETQIMSVLSISRTETSDMYRLILNMPDRNILLMQGSKDDIIKKAESIATSLHSSLITNI